MGEKLDDTSDMPSDMADGVEGVASKAGGATSEPGGMVVLVQLLEGLPRPYLAVHVVYFVVYLASP